MVTPLLCQYSWGHDHPLPPLAPTVATPGDISLSLWECKILKNNSTAQFIPHAPSTWSDLADSRCIFRVCWHLFKMSPMSLSSAAPLGLLEVPRRIQTMALTPTTSAHKSMMSQLEGHFLGPLWCCKAPTVLGRLPSCFTLSSPSKIKVIWHMHPLLSSPPNSLYFLSLFMTLEKFTWCQFIESYHVYKGGRWVKDWMLRLTREETEAQRGCVPA